MKFEPTEEYVSKDEVISLFEDKQRELCPVGRYGRGWVYGSDREEYDRWQELIDQVESLKAVGVVGVVNSFPAAVGDGSIDITVPSDLL